MACLLDELGKHSQRYRKQIADAVPENDKMQLTAPLHRLLFTTANIESRGKVYRSYIYVKL